MSVLFFLYYFIYLNTYFCFNPVVCVEIGCYHIVIVFAAYAEALSSSLVAVDLHWWRWRRCKWRQKVWIAAASVASPGVAVFPSLFYYRKPGKQCGSLRVTGGSDSETYCYTEIHIADFIYPTVHDTKSIPANSFL